jgi:hypothetical protein
MEKRQYLEIKSDKDKKDVAAILVMNGYSVAVETVKHDKGKGKKMLAYWKSMPEKEDA